MPVGWYRPTRRTEPTSRVYSLPAIFGAVPRSWYGRSAKAATRRSRSTRTSVIVIPSAARDLHADACRSLFGVARAVRALPVFAARGVGASAQRLRLQIDDLLRARARSRS